MKHVDRPASDPLLATNWQILGELEAPVGSDKESIIHSWLMETLDPLYLHSDFRFRVLRSAQEAVIRAVGLGGLANESGHIHLRVFGPPELESNGKTWGFFWIDKLEATGENKNSPYHSIELYLYMEGK